MGYPRRKWTGPQQSVRQLLFEPSVFGFLLPPSVQLGSSVQKWSCLLQRRNFHLLVWGGAVVLLLGVERTWGFSGFSYS